MAEHLRSTDRRLSREPPRLACSPAPVGGWTKTRPGSLGLLPSGPDPVGERYVLRQPPAAYVDHDAAGRKRREPSHRFELSPPHAARSSSSTMACAIRAVASSAGNSISSASSESVTSFGVPKTVTVPRKDMTPRRVAMRSGVARRSAAPKVSAGSPSGRRRIGRDLGEQALDDGIGPRVDLLAKHAEHVGAPRGVIDNARAQARRMQGEAHGVDRRTHELRRAALIKLGQGGIRHHEIPVPVDREGGIGLVRLQDRLDGGFRRLQSGDRALRIGRREARRQEERILVAQRDLEKLGETRDHLAARLRLAGLETGKVPGRALRGIGEVGLRHTTPLAPAAQQNAERKLMSGHAPSLTRCSA